jgi:hypothetical protein
MASTCIASRWNWPTAATRRCCRASRPGAGIAASFVYRSFDPAARPPMPSAARVAELARRYPDAMLFRFPKTAGQIARDFKWLASYRYGILHLGGADVADLAARCAAASALLGWPSPCAALNPPLTDEAALTQELSLETPT